MASREQDMQWFRFFVGEARWKFAKTYIKSYPHEYTVDEWCDTDNFWEAILCIERWGVIEHFYDAERKYMYLDDRKYWHMGDASSEDTDERPGLVNRSWVEVENYRREAEKLGYEGEQLDRLIVRWKDLLKRATGAA